MREYKFRGKRTDNGKWVYGDYSARFRRSSGTVYHRITTRDIEYSCGSYPVDPDTVGQYTGLHDNKRTTEYPEGQEIYEGDILKDPEGKVFKVKWQKFSAAWGLKGETRSFLFVQRCIDLFEVIGNIYEQEVTP